MIQNTQNARRPPRARALDRWLTRLFDLGGRVFGRPNEALLNRLTGRSKGGAGGGGSAGLDALLSGRRALSERRYGEALHQLSIAAALLPEDPWPWHGRGDALQLSGQHAAALAAYDEALRRDPALALSHCGRGNALEGLGRLDEARAAWRRALELDPTLPWPREGLARAGAGR